MSPTDTELLEQSTKFNSALVKAISEICPEKWFAIIQRATEIYLITNTFIEEKERWNSGKQ